MTLIACLHPHQFRTLIADVLISSEAISDMAVPTRAYIAPEELRRMHLKPTTLRRKVIEISPELVALWSGDYFKARVFAQRATDWFRDAPVNEEALVGFLEAHYRQPVSNFWAIIVPSNNANRFYYIGKVYRSSSPFAGEYLVAGQGQTIFKDMVDVMRPEEESPPDVAGLRILNDLTAREIVTGEPLRAAFGGAYEVLYLSPNGFERVDDVMHAFALVKVSTNIDVSHYSFVMRQWYENDQLCVFSQVTETGGSQGLESAGFAIPSILGIKQKSIKTVEFLATRPQYLSIHHLFEIDEKTVPSPLILKGDSIDEFFNFGGDGRRISFEPKDIYYKCLRKKAAEIQNSLHSERSRRN